MTNRGGKPQATQHISNHDLCLKSVKDANRMFIQTDKQNQKRQNRNINNVSQ